MKKLILIVAFLIGLAPAAMATNSFVNDVRAADSFTQKIQDVPGNVQIVIDYSARTDGQPVYLGYAVSGKSTASDAWIIYLFTYDGSNQMTTRKTAYGIWDNRASLSYL